MKLNPRTLKSLSIFILLFLHCIGHAQQKWVWQSEVIFLDHHDPSMIDLKNNGSITFDDTTGYDKLKNWEPGQTCLFVYDSLKGLNLINLKNKDTIHISVWYNHTHPIDLICESCIEKNGCTMCMAGCYGEAAKLWKLEINRVCKEIEKSLTKSEQKQLQKTLLIWNQHREAQWDLINLFYEKSSGSISIVRRVQNYVSLIRSQAELFTYYYFY